MTSIDTLISNATGRANAFADAAAGAANTLQSFGASYAGSSAGPLGSTLSLSGVSLPEYMAPKAPVGVLPQYEAPKSERPHAPTLAGVSSISGPPFRPDPSISQGGLFSQSMPSTNLPDFNEAAPDLRVDALVAEMDALAAPVLQQLELPALSALSIRDAPTVEVPAFDALAPPDTVEGPQDYAARMDSSYRQMLPEMQAFIDDKASAWISAYAPEYGEWSAKLQAKVAAGMDGAVLPDEIEAAMFTRARGRVEREFEAVELGLLDSAAKSGFLYPPGAVLSGVRQSRLKSAEALANQATDIYIERRKMEVQHLQFVLGVASTQVMGVRNLAISYAGVVGGTLQQAAGYAASIADKLGKVFDHRIARSTIVVTTMNALNAQYETKLRAALSGLEGFKLELEAEKTKKDVERAQIQSVEAQVKVQELEVSRYSALIDAITRKATLEELKLKGYETRADIFKANTQAKVASFDAYRASVEGDKAKLEGELAKIEVFNGQLKADELRLDAEAKSAQAVEAHNNTQLELFKAGAEVYKLDAEMAVQAFAAAAEVKKLEQSIYGQELSNAVETFKAGLEVPKISMEAMIKQYELTVQAALDSARLDISRMQVVERALESTASSYASIASAAIGSLNTMASSAISEAA